MGLTNFWAQKTRLDNLQDDLTNMRLYVTNVSGCISELDACWIGNRDKQKIVNTITSHLHIVNNANSDINVFKQTATFVLVKMNELGSLVGLCVPSVTQICLPGIYDCSRINPRIQIDTTALRLVADKIEGERKHLDNTSSTINNTQNIIDNYILSLFGLNNLINRIDRRVAEQKQENQKIVSGIRQICDLYERTEKSLNEKIAAMAGLGTTVVADPPVVTTPTLVTDKTPDIVSGGTSTGVEAGKIRQIIQQWDPNGGNPDYDPSVWGIYDQYSKKACGVASASMALSWLGIDMSPQKICELNVNNGSGADFMSSWDQMGCICKKYATEGSTEDIDSAIRLFRDNPSTYSPPIMYLTSPHFVVIMGETDTEYIIRNPGFPGERRLSKPASYTEIRQFSLT